MKKFLLIALLGAISFAGKAQYAKAQMFTLIAGDTLNNVDTVFKGIVASAGYNSIGVQAFVNRLSGTVAGKMILLQSLDGQTYTPTDSASYTTSVVSSATTPAATNTAYITKLGVPGVFYMVLCTSTGTVSAQVRVAYTLRKFTTSLTTN